MNKRAFPMKRLAFLALVSITALSSPANAQGSAVLNELARIEGIDFEVSGILTAGDYMGQDYMLYVPELGNLPAIIDGGRDLRKQVDESCASQKGCEVTVTGRFEFALPVVTFSIGSASGVAHRQKVASQYEEILSCWNVGALSTEAMKISVTVAFEVKDGMPVAASVRMVSSTGGSKGAVRQAFEAARRAVLRCGARGFQSLPDGTTEITFDANTMEVR